MLYYAHEDETEKICIHIYMYVLFRSEGLA